MNRARKNERVYRAIPEVQKLGQFSVICTILNRTIGSSIFVVPAVVLEATGSVGASLLLWFLTPILAICALFVWLEMGLGVPKFPVLPKDRSGNVRPGPVKEVCTPRNGGEKNYLEYVYDIPRTATTCMYGMLFVILGNLSGNAIEFGVYVLQASYGTDTEGNIRTANSAGKVRGLAIACVSSACLLHLTWRKGGIYMIDILAILKTILLIATMCIGFAASAGAKFTLDSSSPPYHGYRPIHGGTIDPITQQWSSNFDPSTSFKHASHSLSTYANSILYILYTFSGYVQPFYVLSEVKRPKATFTRSTTIAMSFVYVLFTLVNVAYLCAVTFNNRFRSSCNSGQYPCAHDMATVFFTDLFGNEKAPRVMSGLIALSTWGKNIVMTFTAAKVKQELAKEGVIPFYQFFAASHRTPWSYLPAWIGGCKKDKRPEESPGPALLLHFAFAGILIGATSLTSIPTNYKLLVALYSYGIVLGVGFFVSLGLLWLRFRGTEFYFKIFGHHLREGNPLRDSREWTSDSKINSWVTLASAILYVAATGFLMGALWIPPATGSPFKYDVEWYVTPVTCMGIVLLGLVYYFALTKLYAKYFKGGRIFHVKRIATLKHDQEDIQEKEEVLVEWLYKTGPKKKNLPINEDSEGDVRRESIEPIHNENGVELDEI